MGYLSLQPITYNLLPIKHSVGSKNSILQKVCLGMEIIGLGKGSGKTSRFILLSIE